MICFLKAVLSQVLLPWTVLSFVTNKIISYGGNDSNTPDFDIRDTKFDLTLFTDTVAVSTTAFCLIQCLVRFCDILIRTDSV